MNSKARTHHKQSSNNYQRRPKPSLVNCYHKRSWGNTSNHSAKHHPKTKLLRSIYLFLFETYGLTNKISFVLSDMADWTGKLYLQHYKKWGESQNIVTQTKSPHFVISDGHKIRAHFWECYTTYKNDGPSSAAECKHGYRFEFLGGLWKGKLCLIKNASLLFVLLARRSTCLNIAIKAQISIDHCFASQEPHTIPF